MTTSTKEHGMRVIDLMSTTLVTASFGTSVVEAFRRLSEHQVSSLPVVDDDGAAIGIVSEQDLLRRSIQPAAGDLSGTTAGPWGPRSVGEVMTPAPHVVREDDDVADVARVFAVMGWKSLPVVRHGRLVGMISRSDVVRALSRPDAAVQRDVELALRGADQPGWTVVVEEGVVRLTGGSAVDLGRRAAEITRSVVGVRAVHLLAEQAS